MKVININVLEEEYKTMKFENGVDAVKMAVFYYPELTIMDTKENEILY